MPLLQRIWFNASVQAKFLLIIVPLMVALTLLGVGLVQIKASNTATERAVSQFDEVGQFVVLLGPKTVVACFQMGDIDIDCSRRILF